MFDLSGRNKCSDFEKARLISQRTRQIDSGYPPLVPIQVNDTAEKIAIREYRSGLLNMFDIGRVHPDGFIEYLSTKLLYHADRNLLRQ